MLALCAAARRSCTRFHADSHAHRAPAALDVTGTFQLTHSFADGIDALFVDLCKPLQRVIPIVRQRQHLREESFGLERQRMVAKMVVGHDRVTFGLFNTENRHFCDLLCLGFEI